jgi:hypothetical protein
MYIPVVAIGPLPCGLGAPISSLVWLGFFCISFNIVHGLSCRHDPGHCEKQKPIYPASFKVKYCTIASMVMVSPNRLHGSAAALLLLPEEIVRQCLTRICAICSLVGKPRPARWKRTVGTDLQ